MQRPVRRRDREISGTAARQLLERGEYGFLATVGPDGQPYGVPLSYVLIDDSLYFHAALDGQKSDNLVYESRVSFTVVGRTEPVYEKDFSTYYESAVAFGRAEKIADDQEKTAVLMLLCEKYLPDHIDKAPGDIGRSLNRTAVWRIRIDRLTGKAKTPKDHTQD